MSVVLALAALLLLAGAAALMARVVILRSLEQLLRRRLNEVSAASLVPTGAGAPARQSFGMALEWLIDVLSVGVSRAWDTSISPVVLVASAVGASVVGWLALGFGLRLPFLVWAPAAIAAAFVPPQIMLRLEQARLQANFIDLFPDAIDMAVRMLRAGLPMTVAVRVVGTEAVSPVKEVFAGVGERMAIGVSFEDALRAAARRLAVPDFRFFAVATSLQQATGGNLAVTLELLSEIIRKRRAARLKAKAVTAEIRMSAYVLSSIPFVVIAGLLLMRPDYLTPLIVDRRGNVILAAAVISLLTGLGVMRQMTQSAMQG